MRAQSNLFRLTSTVAIAALLSSPILPYAAWAQTTPPAADGASADQPAGDPPARVGRLALVTGAVSFHTSSDTDWSPASLNYPVAGGNSFWTEPGAEADLELGGSRIAMNAATEVDLNTLDDSGVRAALPQGEVYVNVRTLLPNETLTLDTPRGTVTISAPGQYAVSAGDTTNPTIVTVIGGAARIGGANMTLDVAAGQAATITGTDTFQGGVGAAARGAFLTAMLARDLPRPVAVGAAAPPAGISEMPGGADLRTVGTWAAAPQYGQVWYPPVAANWVPYRDGHWAYVAPWGWTWVDAAPWGFAPFHYGRWTRIGERWGWVPGVQTVQAGVVARPVYAPALVTFFGVGVAAGVAVGAGAAIGGSVGWLPLGPGEVYRPWYHASERYVQNVNVRVTNVTNITTVNNVTINTYRNRQFATVVEASTLTESRPVNREVRPISAQQLAAARPDFGREPVRPAFTTAGVTPGVARQLRIEPPRGAVARPAAPGPVVQAVARPQPGHRAVVPLRPPAAPATARPGAQEPVGKPAPGQPSQTVEPSARPTEPTAARPGMTGGAGAHPAETPHAPPPQGAPAGGPGAGAHPTETPTRPGVPEPTQARPAIVPAEPPGTQKEPAGTPAPGRPGSTAEPGARPTEPTAARPGAPGGPGARPAETPLAPTPQGAPAGGPGSSGHPTGAPTRPGTPEPTQTRPATAPAAPPGTQKEPVGKPASGQPSPTVEPGARPAEPTTGRPGTTSVPGARPAETSTRPGAPEPTQARPATAPGTQKEPVGKPAPGRPSATGEPGARPTEPPAARPAPEVHPVPQQHTGTPKPAEPQVHQGSTTGRPAEPTSHPTEQAPASGSQPTQAGHPVPPKTAEPQQQPKMQPQTQPQTQKDKTPG